LHEIENKVEMLREIKRIVKEKGRLMVIEFHKRTTPMGLPLDHRIGEEYTEAICNDNGLKTVHKFDLGANFYCLVLEWE
jgi:ubiquinone/menaquinone biosynthesis C-methylase UbiE